MQGHFITFDSLDFSGKSTQVDLLTKAYESIGRKVIQVREPGGTPVGQMIRNILKSSHKIVPRAQLMLFNADRAQLLEEVIKPALAQGSIVIGDRYIDSTVAYQSFALGINLHAVIQSINLATEGMMPDCTIFLAVDAKTRAERAAAAIDRPDAIKRFDDAGSEFQKKLEAGYGHQVVNDTINRISVVKGTGTVEEVHTSVLEALRAKDLYPY